MDCLVVLHHAVPHRVPLPGDGDGSAGAAAVELDAGDQVLTTLDSQPGAQVQGDPAWSVCPESEALASNQEVPGRVITVTDDQDITGSGRAQSCLQVWQCGVAGRTSKTGLEEEQNSQQEHVLLSYLSDRIKHGMC